MQDEPGPATDDQKRIRCFIAVPLEEDALQFCRLAAQESGNCLANVTGRWTPESQWHITLTFLGMVPVGAIPPLAQIIRESADRSPFDIILSGPKWKGRGRGGMVWAEAKSPRSHLKDLYADLLQRLKSMPIDPVWSDGVKAHTHREFQPHVTLARFKAVSRTPELGRILGPTYVGQATRIILFQSTLSAAGSTYNILHEEPFRPRANVSG